MAFVFLLAFCAAASLYRTRSARLDRQLLRTHAANLVEDVRALDQKRAHNYLRQAAVSNCYKSLSISIDGNETFVLAGSPPLSGLSAFLHRLGLIGVERLTQNIIYHGQVIGILHGEKYIRLIIPLFKIFIFVLLFFWAAIFVTRLFLQKKHLEMRLVESKQRFHDLVDLLPDMVLETDLEGTISYANRTAQNWLASTFRQGSTVSFLQCIEENQWQKAGDIFRNSLQGKSSDLLQFTAVTGEKKTFPVLLRAAPIKSGAEIIGTRMILIDDTERRSMEEQLQRDQGLKAIGRMAGGVAHELNNIFSGIISYPELLLLDLEQESSLRRPLEAVRQSGLDASELVSDLLIAARGITSPKETVAPNELIRAYLNSTEFSLLRQKYPDVCFKTSFAPELQNISCSPVHVHKCLTNLLVNGAEAIQGQGTVTLLTENQNLPTPIAARRYSKICIHDDGTEIAPEHLEHLFELFYTRKTMGRNSFGIGLALVSITMQVHGGNAKVISNNRGTTIELHFLNADDDLAQ